MKVKSKYSSKTDPVLVGIMNTDADCMTNATTHNDPKVCEEVQLVTHLTTPSDRTKTYQSGDNYSRNDQDLQV